MAEGSAKNILEDLSAEEGLYEEILRLAQEQKDAVGRKDYEAVAERVQRKQGLMERIDAIESRLGPVKQNWAAVRADLGEEERRAVQARVEAIGATLQALMTVEEELRAALAQVQDRVGAELRRLMQTRRMTSAYGGPGKPKKDPGFLTRRSSSEFLVPSP